MHVKNFTKAVLRDIEKIKRDTKADQNIESNVSFEQLCALLNEYNDSTVKISNKNSLLPFYQFLENRWKTIVKTEEAYPNPSRINECCMALASRLIEYKVKDMPSNPADILQPSYSRKQFVTEMTNYIHEIEQTKVITSPFINLESKIKLDELNALLTSYAELDEEATFTNLQPFVNYLSKRWGNIANTEHSYPTSSSANQVCEFLAAKIAPFLSQSKTASQTLLMPPSVAFGSDRGLRRGLIAILKSEEEQPDASQTLTQTLVKSPFDMQALASMILNSIDRFEKTPAEALALPVQLESQHTLSKLKQLLSSHKHPGNEISSAKLADLIQFLKDRWNQIDGTEASYEANPNTPANQVCEILADTLALAGYKINYLNRNPERLLKPADHPGLTKDAAATELRDSILNDITTRDVLISTLMSLDKSKWKSCLAFIGLDKLVATLSNGGKSQEDIVRSPHLLSENEAYNKAVLFCSFEAYLLNRNKSASKFNSFFAYPLSMFPSVSPYNLTQKNEAAAAVQHELLSDKSLVEIAKALQTSDSDLGIHRGALEERTLGLHTALLKTAAPLPAPAKEEEKVTGRFGFAN